MGNIARRVWREDASGSSGEMKLYKKILGKGGSALAEKLSSMTNRELLRQHIVMHSAQTMRLERLKEKIGVGAREYMRIVVGLGVREKRISREEGKAIMELLESVDMNTVSRANATLTLLVRAFDEQFEPAVNLLIEAILRAKWAAERNKITAEDALEAVYQVAIQAIGLQEEVYGGRVELVPDSEQPDQHGQHDQHDQPDHGSADLYG